MYFSDVFPCKQHLFAEAAFLKLRLRICNGIWDVSRKVSPKFCHTEHQSDGQIRIKIHCRKSAIVFFRNNLFMLWVYFYPPHERFWWFCLAFPKGPSSRWPEKSYIGKLMADLHNFLTLAGILDFIWFTYLRWYRIISRNMQWMDSGIIVIWIDTVRSALNLSRNNLNRVYNFLFLKFICCPFLGGLHH